jgi:hypothetical protein
MTRRGKGRAVTEQIEKMQAELERLAREHSDRMWAALEEWLEANPGKTPAHVTWYDEQEKVVRSAWRSHEHD